MYLGHAFKAVPVGRRAAVTSSVAFGDSSSIKEEEGDYRSRSAQRLSSSLMEEVAAKRSELVRITGARVLDSQLIPHRRQLSHVILTQVRTST